MDRKANSKSFSCSLFTLMKPIYSTFLPKFLPKFSVYFPSVIVVAMYSVQEYCSYAQSWIQTRSSSTQCPKINNC